MIVIEPAGFKEMAWLHTATYGLSPREEEVVEFVVRGASARKISQALYVTEDTTSVFEKVGVHSRQALVKRLSLNTIFSQSPDKRRERGFCAEAARPLLGAGCQIRQSCHGTELAVKSRGVSHFAKGWAAGSAAHLDMFHVTRNYHAHP